jgi:crossover junction endodeoxyribonuclease RusA
MMITLPWPPSANKCWRNVNGRSILSKEAREWRKTVEGIFYSLSLQQRSRLPFCGSVYIMIDAYPPDKRKRDLDNLLKPLLDSLQHVGIYKDDSQIDGICIDRQQVIGDGKVNVFLSEDPFD